MVSHLPASASKSRLSMSEEESSFIDGLQFSAKEFCVQFEFQREAEFQKLGSVDLGQTGLSRRTGDWLVIWITRLANADHTDALPSPFKDAGRIVGDSEVTWFWSNFRNDIHSLDTFFFPLTRSSCSAREM